MYRLATKCTTKSEARNATSVYALYGLTLHEAYESKRHGSFVNNDTRHRHGRLTN